MKNSLLLSLLGAVLLSVGWLGFSGIPLLVAFVPLLIISGRYDKSCRSFWKMFGWVALTFGLWSISTTWWIWYAHWSGAILSPIITIVLFGGMFMLFHYTSKRAPVPLAYTMLIAGWIACEYLYTTGEISFPWLTLGNGFAGDTKLVQWYDTTGVFGGSLWVLLSNVLVYHALTSRRAVAWIAPALTVILPVGTSLVIYFSYEEPAEKVTATVVQPNLSPFDSKFDLSPDETTNFLLRLAGEAPTGTDYIILPETALDDRIYENGLSSQPAVERFRQLAESKYPDTQFIIGAVTFRRYVPGERISPTARDMGSYFRDMYNSAIFLDAGTEPEVYHKSMLVVGAEKMPYARSLKFLQEFILDLGGASGQFGVDSLRKAAVSPAKVTAGAAICWEGVYGEFYSGFARGGAQVMFIISNDGWWKDTQGYRQLFKYSRLRAIETRRSIARSANTGISGFIDQRGDVISRTKWDEQTVVTDSIALGDKMTFYTRYGDYTGRICAYVFALCILYGIAYGIRKRNRMEK